MDEVDIATFEAQATLDAAIRAASRDIPTGESGMCVECDMPSVRIIDGACPRCRDEAERLRARLYAR